MTVRTIAVAMSKGLFPVCIALASQCMTTPAIAADARYKQAIYDYEHKFYRAALRNLDAVCAEDPHNGLAHYYLANCYLNISDKERALAAYGNALSNTKD